VDTGEEMTMADATKVTIMTSDDFQAILDEANRTIEIVNGIGVSAMAAGFAGIALVRKCIKVTDGDVEWWTDFLLRGEEKIADMMFEAPADTFGVPPPPKEKQ
jgi:hypothetical protein